MLCGSVNSVCADPLAGLRRLRGAFLLQDYWLSRWKAPVRAVALRLPSEDKRAKPRRQMSPRLIFSRNSLDLKLGPTPIPQCIWAQNLRP
jgi:hypothetical protein